MLVSLNISLLVYNNVCVIRVQTTLGSPVNYWANLAEMCRLHDLDRGIQYSANSDHCSTRTLGLYPPARVHWLLLTLLCKWTKSLEIQICCAGQHRCGSKICQSKCSFNVLCLIRIMVRNLYLKLLSNIHLKVLQSLHSAVQLAS